MSPTPPFSSAIKQGLDNDDQRHGTRVESRHDDEGACAGRELLAGGVAGPYVFTAGCGPHDPVTREIVGTSIVEQTHQVLGNLGAILEEAGTSLENVIKVTRHLANRPREFADYVAVFREVFTEPYPPRTTEAADIGSILVDMDVVAIVLQ